MGYQPQIHQYMVVSAKPESQLVIRTWQHADELLYLLTYLQRYK